MECVDAHIATGDSFYCLFYEERDAGEHLSRIYHFSGRRTPEIRLVAELEEWLVSLWVNRAGDLFAAAWDGRILSVSDTTQPYAEVDLLGTIKLAGFDDAPRFIMGEDGLVFENTGSAWRQLPLSDNYDVYSVALKSDSFFMFAASEGYVISYDRGVVSVEQLPTNLDLHGLAFIDANRGIAVGDQGVAFLFDGGAWHDVSVDKPSLADAHAFKGRLLVSVEGETIDAVTPQGDFETSLDQPGYYFSSNNDYCLTFFEQAAHVFDGSKWTSVPFGRLITSTP